MDIGAYAERLELDKILARICELAVSDEAKKTILESKPEIDFFRACERLDITDALFVKLMQNSSPNISAVEGIPEIAMRAAKGGTLSMEELLRVRTMLRNSRTLISWNQAGSASDLMDRLFYSFFEDSVLERRINDSILSDTEMSDDASHELFEIRKKIARAEISIREKLDSVIRSSSNQKYLQDAIVTMRGGRFVVPVKQEHRNEIKGLVHDVSSSGSTLFVEPAGVVEANNKIMQLKGEEMREIDRILQLFTANVAGISESLKESYRAFVEVDAALAKAKYAIQVSATKPILNSSGRILLKKARHPLIAAEQVVPIDVELGGAYKTLVITGPNTGGKTVTLKTVGLLTMMAMCGILIPALENSEICVFEQILVDIGDEQSIEQSLSTFSSHVKNTASILNVANARSLVLLDELGAGTDPAEGAALAVAILERLRTLGCKVIATTHYGEIKLYAMEQDGVQNASCEFDIATLRPTYKLVVGIPGRSNALLIGERLGLDAALLEDARRNLSAEERRFEDVLNEIELLKSQLSKREEEIERNEEQAKEILRRAQNDYDKLIESGKRESDAARLKARQLSADVTAGANKLLDEIRKMEQDQSRDNQAARARAKAIASIDAARIHDLSGDGIENEADSLEPVSSVAAGDRVYIVPLAQTGEVLSEMDDKGMVEVKAGAIKTRVGLSALRKPKAAQTQQKKARQGSKVAVDTQRSGRNEIKLLGLTVDEAVMEAEQFIDSAVLSHLGVVYLIHGKGTGALRSGIHSALKTNKHVKRFRLGGYGEGESGVTIVELK